MRQFNKERRKLEHKNTHKHYESSAVYLEAPHPHTPEASQGGATATTVDVIFTAAMEYTATLEDKSNMHSERIVELDARVDGQTVLTNTTYH